MLTPECLIDAGGAPAGLVATGLLAGVAEPELIPPAVDSAHSSTWQEAMLAPFEKLDIDCFSIYSIKTISYIPYFDEMS